MRNPRSKIIIASAVVAVLVIAGRIAIAAREFYPRGRYELSAGKAQSLFAVPVLSFERKVHVKARDWPHTFLRPFTLGDRSSSNRYLVSRFHWSKDGSVVVFLAQERAAVEPSYAAMYDYRNHAGLHVERSGVDRLTLHQKVVDLLDERGGREDSRIEVPALNTGAYKGWGYP